MKKVKIKQFGYDYRILVYSGIKLFKCKSSYFSYLGNKIIFGKKQEIKLEKGDEITLLNRKTIICNI